MGDKYVGSRHCLVFCGAKLVEAGISGIMLYTTLSLGFYSEKIPLLTTMESQRAGNAYVNCLYQFKN